MNVLTIQDKVKLATSYQAVKQLEQEVAADGTCWNVYINKLEEQLNAELAARIDEELINRAGDVCKDLRDVGQLLLDMSTNLTPTGGKKDKKDKKKKKEKWVPSRWK